MNQELHVIVLAAGEGRRMNSRLPKVLQPVAGVPMLAHVLDSALALEPAGLHVVVGHAADQVRTALGSFEDRTIRVVEQSERLGTGHAVQQALPGVPGSARVLVLPGDMPLIRPGTLERIVARTAALTILSFAPDDPHGYGRILRNGAGAVIGIREQRDATPDEAAIGEVNSGVLMARADRLADWLARVGNDNAQGEYYLTDCVALAAAGDQSIEAVLCDDPAEAAGANDMQQLAALEALLQQRRRGELMAAGVRMPVPDSVQVRGTVETGRDVFIDAGVVLEGRVVLGDGVVLGTGCVVRESRLADGTKIEPYCVLDSVETTGACSVGPFARLRAGTVLAAQTRIGNFVETKNARFAAGAKASHLSYVGDADVGARANLGAGTITCNYDGVAKHHTEIGEEAFIGSNSALVAPVRIGARATIGAGSVVSRDAPDDVLTLTRPPQRVLADWARPTKKTD